MIGLELPLRFDAASLNADLVSIPGDAWRPHYNAADFGGTWRGAALRSHTASPADLHAAAPQFSDTSLLSACPYFREALAQFRCPLQSVRLLSLEPDSFIREHSDNALEFEQGEVRIHIPIATNPGVEFFVSGERLRIEPGGAYYVNVNLPHRVTNRGETARIHLVIDAIVNDWLRDLFARSSPIGRCPAPADSVEAFRDAVRFQPERSALRACEDQTDFAGAAVRLGGEFGFRLHENDVDALLRGRPRPGPPGGLPIALSVRGDEAFVEWADAGDSALTEPFFEDSVRALLRNPYVRFSRREAPLGTAGPVHPPAGLIFHVSRCGSTLAGRMLSAAGYRVVSEAPPLDAAIQSARADWVGAIATALGCGLPYVLKLDAWHIHALPLLRAVFPETPWVFLFRDPVEVLASHARSPGRHVLPGGVDPRAVAMAPEDITAVPRAEWPARVLAHICEAALRHWDEPGGIFVDYRDLPSAVESRIVPHFGLTLDSGAADRMREAARFDAKRPSTEFAPDSTAKQAEGAALADAELDRLYRALTVAARSRRESSALA